MGLNIGQSMTDTYYQVNISFTYYLLNYLFVLLAWVFVIFFGLNTTYYIIHKIKTKYSYCDDINITFCAFIYILFHQILSYFTIDFSLKYMRNFVKTLVFYDNEIKANTMKSITIRSNIIYLLQNGIN